MLMLKTKTGEGKSIEFPAPEKWVSNCICSFHQMMWETLFTTAFPENADMELHFEDNPFLGHINVCYGLSPDNTHLVVMQKNENGVDVVVTTFSPEAFEDFKKSGLVLLIDPEPGEDEVTSLLEVYSDFRDEFEEYYPTQVAAMDIAAKENNLEVLKSLFITFMTSDIEAVKDFSKDLIGHSMRKCMKHFRTNWPASN
jgi:hypothetical protein